MLAVSCNYVAHHIIYACARQGGLPVGLPQANQASGQSASLGMGHPGADTESLTNHSEGSTSLFAVVNNRNLPFCPF